MKTDIYNTLFNINSFFNEEHLSSDFSLGSGELGEILYLFEYSKYFRCPKTQELAFCKLEKIHTEIENYSVYKTPDLYSGYTGLAWLYQYLMAEKVIEYDDNITKFFDELIMEQVFASEETRNIDLMYGIVGYGIYLLECYFKNRMLLSSQLNSIVDVLYKLSHKEDDMLFWTDKEFNGMINIGIAHGVAGIAIFLTKVYIFNKNKLARMMAEKSLRFLINIKSKKNEDFSVFPNLYDFQGKILPVFDSRVGWCNGDLGVGFSLFFCGKNLNLSKLYNEGLKTLERTSLRRDQKNTLVYDKGFCHGSSGVFYIYNLLVKEYKLFQFEETRLFWLKEVLKENKNKESFFSLNINHTGEKIYIEERGLLNGYAGIGLSLLSAVNPNNKWAQILLL